MRMHLVIIFVLFSIPSFAEEHAPIHGYSVLPLSNPVFNHKHVIVGTAQFNNWLNTNHSTLDAEEMTQAREHLYYLISSYAYALYKNEKIVLPTKPDLILQTLLSWSERLGAIGGNHFYNLVKFENNESLTAFEEVDKNFVISTKNDMFAISSEKGTWAFEIPYYFMVGSMKQFVAPNDTTVQMAIISTGAAKDNTEAGHSQSTLMFIHSPGRKLESILPYWIKQFSLESASTSTTADKFKSIKYYDVNRLLHTELATVDSRHGAFLIAYLGMDGTYQTNRQHFIDFLNLINILK